MNRVVVTLLVVGVVSACGGAEVLEPARSDVAFEAAASTPEVQAVAASDIRFTVDLLRALADGENLFVSPVSISTALGMVAAGAEGETRAEIAEVLHETLPDSSIHAARGRAFAEISTPDPVAEDQGDAFSLRGANSAWISPAWPFRQAYLDLLARDYGAGVFPIDFGDKANAAEVISGWVEDQTEGRIVDLLTESDIPALTELILVNAVTFDGSWMNQFDPADTRPGEFTLGNGSVVEADMMHGSGFDVPYLVGDGVEAVWLPYWGGASMVIVLPDSTPAEWLAEIDTLSLLEMRRSASDQPFTDLALPRFEFTSRTLLGDTLSDLGMPQAFSSDADLTGMTEPGAGKEDLALAEVIHQAMVRVDEVGTKAAAATAVVATTSSVKPEPRTLVIDRPFLFFIVDDSSGAPAFAGIVEDPTGG